MRFIVMAMAPKESEAGPPPKPEAFTAMQKYNEQAVKAGVLLAAEGLTASSKGARVKFSGDKRTVIDGPFAETKEVIAGFSIIKVIIYRLCYIRGPAGIIIELAEEIR